MAETRYSSAGPADIGSSANEISYLDFSSDGGVRQYTGTNSLPQAHAIQRPRTNVNMQDFDAPPSRPRTPADHGVRWIRPGGVGRGQFVLSGDTLSTEASVHTSKQIAQVREYLAFKKKSLLAIQHACAGEIANIEQRIHILNSGYFTAQDFADIPGIVPSPDVKPIGSSGQVDGRMDQKWMAKDSLWSSPQSPFKKYSDSAWEARDLVRHRTVEDQDTPPLDILGNKPSRNSAIKSSTSLFQGYMEAIKNVRLRKTERELILGRKYERDSHWWTDRTYVEKLALNFCGWAAIFGLSGSVMAIFQNELVYKNYAIQGPEINGLKALNSFFTLLCLACLYYNYHLNVLICRVNRHCRRLTPLETGPVWVNILCHNNSFWIESFLIGLHLPPFITREVLTMTLKNVVVYRLETMGALFNMLRLYLVWKYLRDRELSLILKRHMISGFTGVNFGSIYVLKTLMRGWRGLVTIAVLWICAIFFGGYWFRAAELTACNLNTTVTESCRLNAAKHWELYEAEVLIPEDLYMWDSIWFMIMSTLTVGYGDVTPTTHYGRVCSSAIVTTGMFLGAVLTASLSHLLDWSEDELMMLKILERGKARAEMQKLAQAKLSLRIRSFLRKRRKSNSSVQSEPRTILQRLSNIHTLNVTQFLYNPIGYFLGHNSATERNDLTAKLRKLQIQLASDVSNVLSDGFKIDKLYSRVKHMYLAVAEISNKVKDVDSMEKIAQKLRREENDHHSDLELVLSITLTDLPPELKKNTILKRAHHRVRKAIRQKMLQATSSLQSQEVISIDEELQHQKKIFINRTQNDFAQRRIDAALKTIPKDWWRDKVKICTYFARTRLFAAILAAIGTLTAIAQNEAVIYGSSTQVQLNLLKCVNSAATVMCLIAIIRMYWLKILLGRIFSHIHRLNALDTRFSLVEVLWNRRLWLELFMVSLHCPPFVEFSFGVQTMNNFVIYEIETIFACVNLFRLYLVWRAFSDWMLSDLPKRHTLAGFASLDIGTTFVIKRMLHSWRSLYYVFGTWIVCLMFFGYLFRSAEMTACLFPIIEGRELHERCSDKQARIWVHHGIEYQKTNDQSFQNACWHMFVTATTVGYGETAIGTHFGRQTAVLAGFLGMVLVSSTTACLCNLLEWSSTEETANAVIERESKRRRLREVAVDVISEWWRARLKEKQVAQSKGPDWLAAEQKAKRMRSMAKLSRRKSFISVTVDDRFKQSDNGKLIRALKSELANEELDEFQGMSEKVDMMTVKVSKIEDELEAIHHDLWLDGTEDLISKRTRELKQDFESISDSIAKVGFENLRTAPFQYSSSSPSLGTRRSAASLGTRRSARG